MRFSSPTPPPPTPYHRSVSFQPFPQPPAAAGSSSSSSSRPSPATSKQRPPKQQPLRPTGRFGLDVSRKREWDASSSEASTSSSLSGSDDEGVLDIGDSSEEDEGELVGRRRSRPPTGSSALRGGPAAYIDEIEAYDLQARSLAWRKSHQTALAHSTHLASLLTSSSSSTALHSASLSSRPRARSGQQQDEADEGGLGEVRRLLEGLRVESEEEERKEREGFERRNKKLWDDIESTIQSSEQAHIRAAQLKQAEADRQAAASRKAAEEAEASRLAALESAKRAEEAKKAEEEKQAKEKGERERKEGERREAERMRKEGGGGLEVKADEFGHWVGKMKAIKTDVLPKVAGSAEWKKKCNAVKRQMTPKVGQITNDRQAILRITAELSLILHSALAASPEIYTWLLNHLSKILIRQAEAEVTANPSAAWPLARLVVGLMGMGHAEGLGEVLMSRLVKKCCWVVPFSPAKQPDQTEDEHRKLLGHLSSTQESTVEYTNRLSGILTLYGSILCVLPSPALLPSLPPGHPPYPAFSPSTIPPHFRPSAAWSWIAAIVRPPLGQLEPTPTLISAFLDVVAPTLLKLYGAQAAKMLKAIGRDVLGPAPSLGGGKNKPGLARLGVRLEEWQKGGFGAWKPMEGSEVLS